MVVGLATTAAILACQIGSVGAVLPVAVLQPNLHVSLPLAHRESAATVAPRITREPVSVTVAVGVRARFVARAEGSPAPREQWQLSTNAGKTWNRVPGATSPVYAFVGRAPRAGDEFRAVFHNSAGSARTRAAVFRLVNATKGLVSTSSKALAVKPGSPPARSSGSSGGSSSANGSDAANNSGSARDTNTAPTITVQPLSATVTAGATVNFVAAATGTPVPTVTWQVSTNSGGSWTTVSGAISDTYSFVGSTSQSGDSFHAVFTNAAGSATTNAATLAVNAVPVTGGAVITAGNSKANCIFLNAVNGVLTAAELSQVEATTRVTYNCIEQFADQDPQWSNWVNPWPTATVSDGWDAWLAASPDHQLVLGLDLVPNSVSPSGNPTNTAWEAICASGTYDQYAVELATNLVAEGAGNSVIRLGKEFNGDWENDFVGNPSDSNYSTEIANWDSCYQNEVTAMRSVPGEHFLFDWNPNTCMTDFPLSQGYPGNAYVDIIGADFYDADCYSGDSAAVEGWNTLYTLDGYSQVSLSEIVAFAEEEGKPLSIPEWGEVSGDDTAYMNGVISVVENDDVAYQSYFDCNCDSILPLGSTIPASTALYQQTFG